MARAVARNTAAKTHQGHLWSKIIDAMIGSSVADGDLLLRSGGQWTRKAIGTESQYLRVVSSVPDWDDWGGGGGGGDFYAASYQSADQYVDNTTTGTTLVNSGASLTLGTGTFRFFYMMFTDVDATPDYKSRIHFTGTASSFVMQRIGIIHTDVRYFNGIETAFDAVGFQTTTAEHVGFIRGTIVVTSGGDLVLQFAQNAASAIPVGHLRGGAALAWEL